MSPAAHQGTTATQRLTFFSASLACASLIFDELCSLQRERGIKGCWEVCRAFRTQDRGCLLSGGEICVLVDAGFEEGLKGGAKLENDRVGSGFVNQKG